MLQVKNSISNWVSPEINYVVQFKFQKMNSAKVQGFEEGQ